MTGAATVYAEALYGLSDAQKQFIEEINENAEAEKRNATAKEIITELIADVNKMFPSYKNIGKIIIRENEFIKTTTSKIKRNEPENKSES